MIEIVTESATKRYLTSLARIKTQGQISTVDEDAFIATLAKRASAAIEQHCARIFRWRTVIESVPSSGGADLLLSCRPVVDVTALAYRGEEQDIADLYVTDAEAGVIFLASGFQATNIMERFIDLQPSPYYRSPDWAVSYSGGYVALAADDVEPEEDDVPPEGTPDLPEDLIEIATDLALILYDDRKRNKLRTSESEGDASADYRTMTDFLAERCAVWRNVVI